MKPLRKFIFIPLLFSLYLSACVIAKEKITVFEPPATEAPSPSEERELKIVTLLPKDAIPAIDEPQFLEASEADEQYAPDELVLGVEFNGEARAYSIPHLSSHEIVNDTVGGVKFAVTW